MTQNSDLRKSLSPHLDAHSKANFLVEILPYVQQYAQKVIVIKIGGNVIDNPQLLSDFCHDIVLLRSLGVFPIIVHGGGPQINAYLKKLKIKTDFVNGLRKTSAEVMHVVEMVLCGHINKKITANIQQAGGMSIGVSGRDNKLIQAKAYTGKGDIGNVGYPTHINTYMLNSILKDGVIPVIAPIGCDAYCQALNINADTAAGEIAIAMSAIRLLLLTDVDGIKDKNNQLLTMLTTDNARELITHEVATGGMIPKLETCIHVVENHVSAAVIINGTIPHACLLELFTTQGGGTLIIGNEQD